jgi:hypothetical protein
MGADANQPGDELTDQEKRAVEDWLARIRQALAEKGARSQTRILPPDPQLTRQLQEVCATIADAMANHEPAITEALTDASIRAEMKQLVSDLATFLMVLVDENARRSGGGTPEGA